MMKFICVVLLLFVSVQAQNQYKVYINEIRVNDDGTDDIEFIELIGPEGTVLTDFQIIHYNGSETMDAIIWNHTIGTFTLPDDGYIDNAGRAIGYYVLAMAGVPHSDETLPGSMQNGPDGIILYDNNSNIIDAVAWGGEGDLTDDNPGTVTTAGNPAANNFLHVTVNDDASDFSLQAPDNVLGDNGSGWTLSSATPGDINVSQTDGEISLPVKLSAFSVEAGNSYAIIRWTTQSEVNNRGFNLLRKSEGTSEFEEICSYLYNDHLRGQINSNESHYYSYTDRNVLNNITYNYLLQDISMDGSINEHGPVSVTPGINQPGDANEVFENIRLYRPFPNPFNPKATLRFDIPAQKGRQIYVNLNIYNIHGTKVKTLIENLVGEVAGFETSWDATDNNNVPVSSGIYFAVLSAGELIKTQKLILIK